MNSPQGGHTTTTPNGVASIRPSGIMPELLTSKQAAQLCGCGERSLWRWSRSGRAPAPVRIGDGPRAAVRFRRADLVQWINEGCPAGSSSNSR